jgi:hypothetical protein
MLFAGAGTSLAVASAPAGASNTEMTGVGSFTTFFMMHALFPEINMINPNKESGSLTQSIASDSQTCSGGITYSTGNQPPNGSGQGKTQLANQENAAANVQGCLDFSRSSSPPAPHSETLPSGGTEGGDPAFGTTPPLAPSHLDYYAYGLDGVTPIVGTDAPSTARVSGQDVGPNNGLTLAQVQGIYSCQITNWNQITVNGVTGANSPIVIFWPQSGSGTRAVYTDVLGFDPTDLTHAPENNCNSSDEVITGFTSGSLTAPNEENTEDGLIYENTQGVPASALATNWTGCPSACTQTGSTSIAAGSVDAAAIYIYSAGKFAAEWNDTADNTSTAPNVVATQLGVVNPNIGNFLAGTLSMATMQDTTGNGESFVDLTPQIGPFRQDTNRGTFAIDGSTVSETNEWYHNLPAGSNPSDSSSIVPGVRYVFNVADTLLPSYDGAKNLIGFDNQTGGARSVLCNGDDASTITAQGFLPLTFGPGPVPTSDAAGAACRQFSGLAYPGQGTVIHWTTPTFDNRDH